ncbi:Diguanylate cyclase/phosphodiesterase [Thiomonas sp. CB3]|nr:Diguanylate cyclase/phosphodiesterase [Thiomonas sp. CB3]CQR43897.1 Diguanylate cyclase/phosphodiesterase [Thiomonas sp. CB3]
MLSLVQPQIGYLAILLDRLLSHGELRVEFQPVFDLRGQSIHAFEALARGPQGSPLERPDALFQTARENGRLYELDALCVRTSLETFARLNLPGQLFINVTQTLLDSGWLGSSAALDLLQRLGLPPSRIVFELLESDDLLKDGVGMEQAEHLHRLGFALALDDMGRGFGRFEAWQRLHPRYLKIDRAFCAGLADDAIKAAFVRSMLLMAEASRSWVVAEGVESARDLRVLREIGVQLAQGFVLERPSAAPSREMRPAQRGLIEAAQPELYPLASRGSVEQSALGLARPIAPVQPQVRLEEVLRRFDAQPDLMSIPVVDANGRALGILNRYVLADRLWRPHVRDLLGNKPCAQVMSADVLKLDVSSSLHQASQLIADASFRHATEGVLVTEQGDYRGLLLVGDLLRLVNEFQIQTARYANPLTLLPGNVPINEQIDRLLASGQSFVAAYGDIDHFKPFNDVFGYRLGDEVIVLLADLLRARFGRPGDFVGHIGGDDFIVVSAEPDAVERLQTIPQEFAAEMPRFFNADQRERGGYEAVNRRGEAQWFGFPTVSFGVLTLASGQVESHREVSALLVELKKVAKAQAYDRVFIDRRQYGPQVGVQVPPALR